jgi:hypothetical protein
MRVIGATSLLFSGIEIAEADVISIALCGFEVQDVSVNSAMQNTLTARILMSAILSDS